MSDTAEIEKLEPSPVVLVVWHGQYVMESELPLSDYSMPLDRVGTA